MRKSHILVLAVLTGILTILAVPALAASMQWAGVLNGVTHPYDDYPISMNAGATISVSLQCLPTGELDPLVVILDSQGVVLDNDDDGGTPDCNQGSSSFLTFTAPATGVYIVQANSYEVFGDDDPTDVDANGPYILTITGDFSLLETPETRTDDGEIRDGRVNSRDLGAPLAVYCPDGLPEIYAINSEGAGTLALTVTQEQIDAVGIPEVNTVIAEGQGIRLFRLTSGEYQAVSAPDFEGKVYQVRFAVCVAGAAIDSFTG